MKFAAIQHDIVWCDRQANFSHISELVAQAAKNGAQFVLLSEMFSTGFVVDRHDIGEQVGSESSQFLSRMASQHNIYIGGSCPEIEQDDKRPFNSFVIASPDGTQERYHKIHPFTYGGEDTYFRAGDQLVTTTINNIRISLFVCYDLRFSHEFWTLAPDTDVYLVPANWPASRREHWISLLRARAIENQAYVIGCNRVGSGGGLDYVGDSRIVSPLGEELVADSGETIIYADIDPTTVRSVRENFPFMQDRRS